MAAPFNDHHTHRKRVKRYNVDYGLHYETFSIYRKRAILTNDEWRIRLAESIRQACDATGFLLWAYVFMPEHIHLLVKADGPKRSISQFLSEAKLDFSLWLLDHLRSTDSPLLKDLTVRERPGKMCGRVWQEGGGYSLNVRSIEQAWEKARYIHGNPVRRGLVRSPEMWRWSSYRWLEMNEREKAPLRIDEWMWE